MPETCRLTGTNDHQLPMCAPRAGAWSVSHRLR